MLPSLFLSMDRKDPLRPFFTLQFFRNCVAIKVLTLRNKSPERCYTGKNLLQLAIVRRLRVATQVAKGNEDSGNEMHKLQDRCYTAQNHNPKSPVAMGKQRSCRCGCTGSCSRGPAHRRLRPYGRYLAATKQQRISAAT